MNGMVAKYRCVHLIDAGSIPTSDCYSIQC